MTKELWVNLPVKDVNRSREFFTAIGFSFKNSPAVIPKLRPLWLLAARASS